jgi:transposase-like protein
MKRYPPELKERAMRMVQETIEQNNGEQFGVVSRVARQLGIGEESLRAWFKQAQVDGGRLPGVTSDERRRIAELERENRELRRANEILKSASAFFAAELDGRRPTAEMTRYIDTHKDRYGVEPICGTLQVAPSTYYAARSRPPSARRRRDEELKPEIGRVHGEHYGVTAPRRFGGSCAGRAWR